MKRLILCAVMLAGCGGPQKTVLPDGSQGFVVYCRGEMACHQEAGKACASGYDVLERTSSAKPYYAANQYGAAAGVNESYGLLFRCR